MMPTRPLPRALPRHDALADDARMTLSMLAWPCLVLAIATAAALAACSTTPLLARGGVVNGGSLRVLLALMTLPLWLCLLVLLGASMLAGAFDRLTRHRGLQALGVLLAASAVTYLVGRGALLQQAVHVLLWPALALTAACLLWLWQRRDREEV